MSGEIFISYRRADERWARLLHARLKELGVDAWYDAQVGAGEDWRTTTARALEASRIFVLLFSTAASVSDDIAKELAAATLEKKLIVPVRLEDIQPKGAFLYELASRNWINAFENTEAKLDELAKSLAALVKSGRTDPSMLPFDRAAGARKERARSPSRPGLMAAGGALALAVVIGLVAFLMQPKPGPLSQRIAFFGFEPVGNDFRLAELALTATNEVSQALSKARLELAARSETLVRRPDDLFAKASELHALYVLSGDIHVDGDDIAASIRLEDVPTRTTLWESRVSGYKQLLPSLPTRVAANASTIIRCVVELRSSLARDDMEVVRDLPPACEDITMPGAAPGSLQLWRELGGRTRDSARMQATFTNMLADIHSYQPQDVRANLLVEAETAAKRAYQLDPGLPLVQLSLYNVAKWKGESFAEQEKYLVEGLKLGPDDPWLRHWYGNFLRTVGRVQASLAYSGQSFIDQPLMLVVRTQHARGLVAAGDLDEANMILARTMEILPNSYSWNNWMTDALYSHVGDPDAVLAWAPRLVEVDLLKPEIVDCWKRMRDALAPGNAKAREQAYAVSRECLSSSDPTLPFVTMAALDHSKDALQLPLKSWSEVVSGVGFLYTPSLSKLRAEPGFEKVAEQLGLMKYWRIDGDHRPDFCETKKEREVPVCKALLADP